MQVFVEYGRQRTALDVADDVHIASSAAVTPVPLTDLAAAVRAAVDQPRDYPALRQALTPDDQVAVLVDERLPQLPALLVPLLKYVVAARIPPQAITLLCNTPSTGQPWLEQLPDELEDVQCEVHDPHDRRRLSFVTTARNGKPLFFNRTAVDAAQLVVLSGQRYDPLLGYGGGPGAIYPYFSDRASRAALSTRYSLDVPETEPWQTATEAAEAAWLLGAPFFVQVIEGTGDDVVGIVGGTSAALGETRQRHDALWRRTVSRRADTVLATIAGDPERHTFADLADAVSCASRVVQPGGIIVVLSEAKFPAGPATALLREAGDPTKALREIERRKELELRAAWQWASVARNARICVLSGLEPERVKELFATPVQNLEQVQKLVSLSQGCLIVNDADKTLAQLSNPSRE